ncbi:aminopeptidase [Chelatococcus sp. GCM10030263]|uniref:aminopeptidase n=1 Tax=Chelatococcus sp. GCM10030263 TaxID=3273387 RepID=UPI00360E2751
MIGKEALMMAGAHKIVRVCAGLKPDERVLIVTDPERYRVASALAAAVRDVGPEPLVVVQKPNEYDGQEPHPLARDLMLSGKIDVMFMPVTRSISHSRAVHEALDEGVRVLSLPKFEEEQLYRGGIHADFDAQKPQCDEMARRFGAARTARLTTPAGTDLSFDLAGRPGNSHPCIAREPGKFTALINIEANVAPIEGTTEGTLIVDGSISNFDIGPISQPIEMKVERGRVVSIRGGSQGHRLRTILEKIGDEGAYDIAQLAVGLNPECTGFNGWFSNEHGVYGSCHIGIGTSENLGGSSRAPVHYDVMMSSPTLTFDGEDVVRDGKVLI